MSDLSIIYFFFEKYAVPLLFAIGLLYFFFGVIEYFIIGKGGDEERSQHGRELFLKSIIWFLLAIILFGLVSFIGWLSNLSFDAPTGAPAGGRVDTGSNEGVLPVPNVPTR